MVRLTTVDSRPFFIAPGTPPPSTDAPVIVLAGARQRIVARLIDTAAVAMALIAPQILLMAGVITGDVTFEAMAVMTLAGLFAVLWGWMLLRVARLVLCGCTVGQRIAGLRVLRMDDLRWPSWRHAFNRWRPTWGHHNTPGIGPWSDPLAHYRDERTRRCIHDRTAGTVVVQAGVREPVRRAALAATLPLAALAIVLAFFQLT